MAENGKACRCECGYTCGGPGVCELFAKDVAACINGHWKKDCDHEFEGWQEFEYPGGGAMGTTVCKNCGLTAASHDMRVGP